MADATEEAREARPSPTAEGARPGLGAAVLLLAAACAVAAVVAVPHDADWQAAVADSFGRVALDDLRLVVSPLGKSEVLVVLACLVGLAGLRRVALRALVALVLVGLLVGGLKSVVARERPDGGAHSFPSGDSACTAVVAVALALEAPVAVVPAAAAVAAVGMARLSLNKHYPSDVLAGAAIGLLLGWCAARLVRREPVAFPRWSFALLGGGVAVLGATGALPADAVQAVESFARYLLVPALILLLPAVLDRVRPDRPPEVPVRARWPLLAVIAAGLVLSWFLATRSSLWDRDEPRFARATVEMIESGDWLVPTFNGALRPDKPILIYWLMSLPVRAFGRGEWAFRAWNGVGVAVSALLVGWLAARLVGRRAAVPAAFALASAPLALVAGTLATTDGVLLALVTAACVLVVLGAERRWPWWLVPALGSALGLALLTKGPVGLAPPLFLATVVVWRDRRGGSAGRAPAVLAAAVVVGLGAFLAWGIPADAATGGELARLGLGHHVVARAVRPLESHGGNALLTLPFYLLVLPVALFPWIGFVPAGIAVARAGAVGGSSGRAVVAGWVVPFVVLLSLVQTKLPHYVLPVLPALALLVGGAVGAISDGRADDPVARWLRRGVWLVAPTGVLLGGALVLGPSLARFDAARSALASVGLAVLALTWTAAAELRHGTARRAALVSGGGLLLLWVQLALSLPAVDEVKPSPGVAAIVHTEFAADVPVSAVGYTEASLVFYVGRPIERIGPDEVVAWAERPGPGALVATREILDRASTVRRLPVEVVGQRRGFNFSKGRWADVLVCRRTPPPSGGQVSRSGDRLPGATPQVLEVRSDAAHDRDLTPGRNRPPE